MILIHKHMQGGENQIGFFSVEIKKMNAHMLVNEAQCEDSVLDHENKTADLCFSFISCGCVQVKLGVYVTFTVAATVNCGTFCPFVS